MQELRIDRKIIITKSITFIVSLLIGSIIISYGIKNRYKLFSIGIAQIGIYGTIMFSFLLLQQFFSILNNYQWIPSLIQKSNRKPKVGLQVVGYREDKKLFKVCLDSIKKQNYSGLHQIIVGIDGNDQTDLIMESVFKQVFPFGRVIRLKEVFKDMEKNKKQFIKKTTVNDKFICISQPHKGKRDIMYTCFHCHSQETELIALTDSDTVWKVNTLQNLICVMIGHDRYRQQENKKDLDRKWFFKKQVKKCGAVTGDVGIYKQNYLSFLTSLRYCFAFNFERAADSYFGVVNCVSGPLGHILSRGLSIFYSNKAFVQTDTPAQLLRWIPQQTRWCKSFCREFVYNIRSFYMHSIWMAIDLIFQFIYPLFVILTLLWFRSLNQLMMIYFFLVMMGALRGVFGFLRTGKLRFMHYGMYVFLYILCLIPSKLWAIITLWNNDWGTSTRFQRCQEYIKSLHSIIWSMAFVFYIAFFLIKYFIQGQQVGQLTAYAAWGALSYIISLIVFWKIWGIIFLIPQAEQLLQKRYKQAGVQVSNQKQKVLNPQKHNKGISLEGL